MIFSAESPDRHIHRVRTSAQVREAAAIVAEAFCSLRSVEWLVPEIEQRQAVLTDVFAIVITHALDYGHVDRVTPSADPSAVGGTAGVAVWFHNEQPSPPPPNYDRRLRLAAGARAERFARRDALFEAHHPPAPHHHLALVAVRPAYQGAQVGTALLQHHQAWLDAQRTPAYLEAAGLGSRRLYWHLGYRPHGDSFALPNGARFYPMWRDPQPVVAGPAPIGPVPPGPR